MKRRTAYLRLMSFRRAVRKGDRPHVSKSLKETWLRFKLLRSTSDCFAVACAME